jgi:tetratricopeptide (TPR) repeat protein
MPGWRVLFVCLLLVGLAACASLRKPREEEVPSLAAPSGETAGQAVSAEELPEPQAESSATESPAAERPGEGAMEPALSGVEPAFGGRTASGGESGPPALPVPRPPAEAKKPAGKTKAAGEPAKVPAASPAKPSGAAASAPAAKPGAAAKPAAAQPAAAVREVLARRGDTVVIDLEGRGWLLLPGDRRGVSFLGSESGAQRTSFSFKALELGEYELAFQLQDNTRGASTAEVVRLRVLPEEQFREMLALKAGSPPTAGSAAAPAAGQGAVQAGGMPLEVLDPARLQKAEALFAGGFYDLALPEYLAIYREADSLLNDRLAAIYLQKGEAAAAAKFYDRNLASSPPFGRNAIIGLVRAGLVMAAPELVLQHLPALLELPPEETRAELLGVARFAASQGRHALALDLLTQYLRRFPRGIGLDAAYFQLARLYELESPLRDVRLAREYYRKVYEEFPESEHAGEARSRILYLDRYFFHVQ